MQGFPPDWLISASDIPVKLDGFTTIIEDLDAAFRNPERMFVVLGPAGSGKTTATMSALIEYGLRNPDVPLYELSRDTPSPSQVFKLLLRLHKDRFIVYISDLFLFGDAFRDVVTSVEASSMLIVASSRQSEWSDHLSRYYGDISRVSTFQKFSHSDFDPLIDKILTYVPAPRFRKLSKMDQYKELTKSKSQLLIALREATDSKNFNEIIADEYLSIKDSDTRSLLLIVGVATMARVGISPELAREAYGNLSPRRDFWRALEGLEGIVSISEGGRYFARHDIYVRYIIENLATTLDISSVLSSILKSYVKYKMPIIKSVSRQDSHLFKFVLNKDFIRDISDGSIDVGIGIYSCFDVDFQLDGHFWLQYGLYMASFNKLFEAIEMLENSIRAFSGNPYAIHALAGLQLRLAGQRHEYDTITKDLIKTAVRTLNLMDSQSTLSIDEYPIVTLSHGHVAALVRHGRRDEAISVAKEYFERLKVKAKTSSSPAIDSMQGKLMKFVTLGDWGAGSASSRNGRKRGGRRRG